MLGLVIREAINLQGDNIFMFDVLNGSLKKGLNTNFLRGFGDQSKWSVP